MTTSMNRGGRRHTASHHCLGEKSSRGGLDGGRRRAHHHRGENVKFLSTLSTCLLSTSSRVVRTGRERITTKGLRFFNVPVHDAGWCSITNERDFVVCVCVCLMMFLLLSQSFVLVRARFRLSLSLSRADGNVRLDQSDDARTFSCLLPRAGVVGSITHAHAHTTLRYIIISRVIITYSSFPTPRASSSSSATRATLSR